MNLSLDNVHKKVRKHPASILPHPPGRPDSGPPVKLAEAGTTGPLVADEDMRLPEALKASALMQEEALDGKESIGD